MKTTYKILQAGVGDQTVSKGDRVRAHLTVKMLDKVGGIYKKLLSTKDNDTPITYQAGVKEVPPGWDAGTLGMKWGEERSIVMPSKEAWAEEGYPPWDIPPMSIIAVEVKVVAIIDNPTLSIADAPQEGELGMIEAASGPMPPLGGAGRGGVGILTTPAPPAGPAGWPAAPAGRGSGVPIVAGPAGPQPPPGAGRGGIGILPDSSGPDLPPDAKRARTEWGGAGVAADVVGPPATVLPATGFSEC